MGASFLRSDWWGVSAYASCVGHGLGGGLLVLVPKGRQKSARGREQDAAKR
jgi:hypothetical protein